MPANDFFIALPGDVDRAGGRCLFWDGFVKIETDSFEGATLTLAEFVGWGLPLEEVREIKWPFEVYAKLRLTGGRRLR